MRITKGTPALPKKLPAAELPWQTGDYARLQEYRFHLPYGFLLLCKLWGVTPNEVISDFMDNLSCGSWKRDCRDEAKVHLLNYTIEMGYGHSHFSSEEQLQIFTELDSIGLLWPGDCNEKMMSLHVQWRNSYYNWWFEKWYRKNERK